LAIGYNRREVNFNATVITTFTCDHVFNPSHFMLTVGALLGGIRHFGNFAIFSKLTPILVEFVEEKRGNWFLPYLELGKTIWDEILVNFGSLRPSGAIGAGFRAIGGHLQRFLLQGSFQGHQGHFSVGAVWRLCSAIFGASKAMFR
jgi:hypothetical protein